jgi:hypothetical protein
MKKYLIVIMSLMLIFMTGCSMGKIDNTPTKKVEKLLKAYQMNDEIIMAQMNATVENDVTLNTDQKLKYKDILKRQYSDMTYKIKDEVINGDDATVTAQIEVYDYYKTVSDAQSFLAANPAQFANPDGAYDNNMYLDYKFDQMKNTTNKVTYTIDFKVKKIDDKWQVEDLNDEDREKIHGLYAY